MTRGRCATGTAPEARLPRTASPSRWTSRAQLRKFPYPGPEVGPGSLRELQVPGFPFVLSYVLEEGEIIVLGFSQTSRDPDYRKRFRR